MPQHTFLCGTGFLLEKSTKNDTDARGQRHGPELRDAGLIGIVLATRISASVLSHLCRSQFHIKELRACQYSADFTETERSCSSNSPS